MLRVNIDRAYGAAKRSSVPFYLSYPAFCPDQQGKGAFDNEFMKGLFEQGVARGKTGEPFTAGCRQEPCLHRRPARNKPPESGCLRRRSPTFAANGAPKPPHLIKVNRSRALLTGNGSVGIRPAPAQDFLNLVRPGKRHMFKGRAHNNRRTTAPRTTLQATTG